MATPALHRFEEEGKRYVVDPETCFCFECDAISWDVAELYPHTPTNQILHQLGDSHPAKELEEVVGELEWLRATKSILQQGGYEQLLKSFELEGGLERLTVFLPQAPPEGRQGRFRLRAKEVGGTLPSWLDDAAALLLARSGKQQDLYLELNVGPAWDLVTALEPVATRALKAAALAGKTLTVAVTVPFVDKLSKSFDGHGLVVRLELAGKVEARSHLKALAGLRNASLAKVAKALQSAHEGVGCRAVLQPGHPDFADAVQELEKAGFRTIELDLAGAYVANPQLVPEAMVEGLRETARHYAKRLLKHKYYRLDPIAPLFWRIYNGTPLPRSDPAGLGELAIDAQGGIYPSRYFVGKASLRVGSIIDATIDEDALAGFEDIGSLTTPACMKCWARNLCGGGVAAVHQVLSGNYRRPHEAWCVAQRSWMESAVAAFNLLSSEGVNFSRVYQSLAARGKISLFSLARAAFRMNIGIRPTEESDAEALTQWENWNESAYFLSNESGILLATNYDREMDSLYGRGIEQEFMLLRKNGAAFGLLKLRPDKLPGVAQAWVYMRSDEDYASESIRKSFRALLKETASGHDIRRITMPAGPSEEALCAFLKSVGFQEEGSQREALYLHGEYHDVRIFACALDSL